jgi:glycosyltransferase involved in cell wall biosynthesis
VVDPYEGFDDVRRFVDLADAELEAYLDANVTALRIAHDAHHPDAVFTGHIVPGAVIGRRALGTGWHVAKIHGSDLEYAIRPQQRYRGLAREGLGGARAVVGPSAEVVGRCAELVGGIDAPTRVVPPGVDVTAFRPRPRAEALREVADLLDGDPATSRGRPASMDREVERALAARDLGSIDAIGERYDEHVPESAAPEGLRRLASNNAPIVGYLGKLIPQKGVDLLLQAHALLRRPARALVVGFGSHRERLAALTIALRAGDLDAIDWLAGKGTLAIDPALAPSPGRADVTFTGVLDHRYAPDAVAAMDVQVVPSIVPEAFGMVAVEGAAAGALPVVARHSGLAEVAAALEHEVGRPGLFSYPSEPDPLGPLTGAIDRILELPAQERSELRRRVSSFVAGRWTWERTAASLLDAAVRS